MHPNAQKKRLYPLLANGAVASEEQLRRAGLWRGAVLQNLPMRVVSMATHGKGTVSPVNCVALKAETLGQHSRVLGHQVGMFELRGRRPLPVGYTWVQALQVGSTGRYSRPDWLVLDQREAMPTICAAVEIDITYGRADVEAKLLGAAEMGYRGYMLGTVFHDRVDWFVRLAGALARAGRLPGVEWVEAHFLNTWTATDPYGPRPRCRKLNSSAWQLRAGGQRPSAE